MSWQPTNLPYAHDLESPAVLKALIKAHKALGQLQGLAKSIPRQDILINSLIFQEAKDSSEIENIVTTHDELYKSTLEIDKNVSPETKEVRNYVAALKRGFDLVRKHHLLTCNHILEIQEILEENNAGFRRLPGTTLKNDRTGEVVFTPPQDADTILALMQNLERFINDSEMSDLDPIVKMAVIHFQFESIHPFYDGNGRTGRIINILYLVLQDLMDLPILYLSRYIIQNKSAYYQHLQNVREKDDWEGWLLYMIQGVENTAWHIQKKVTQIKSAMAELKNVLRQNYKFYSQDLLNHLFNHPYTRIEYVQEALMLKSRQTAASYLNHLAADGVLIKREGRPNYYINPYLINALAQ
ncbi:MAG: Fic family protein [Mongoliibacter sp.]|uniref:Fic family protein n=1 Tax=Mongoliibacter sp. TaxID=2022438 RepID=UPI0012F35F3D|nr:Fic family protein [Mongoliibacter sp.]TVP48411.1 MAG: Fic family protein [Mongoliibacter sp.]